LENVDDQWSVQAQWGRRGSALQSDVKASGVTYEEAKRVYDRILREKVGKGYQIAEATANGNAAISVGLPATKEHSGHTPELLTPIEEPEALQLAQDVSWWFQQKFDGRRLAVQKTDGKYSGINKLGQIIPIHSRLAGTLDLVQAEGFLADGEITDSHFYIWDLLSVNDTDLRVQPYEIRYVHLTRLFRGVHETLRVCQTAMTPKDKRVFVTAMHDANAEGFVCKNRYAAYAGGRADSTTNANLLPQPPSSLARNPTRKQVMAIVPSPCISWTANNRVSWARWESPTAIHSRAWSRLSKCVTSTAIPGPKESSSKRSISARYAMTSKLLNAPSAS
jgi:predicted DNA-binding WGR domain protein